MALCAVVGKPGVTARNFSRIKKYFATARLKKHDTGNSADDSEEADPKTRSAPRMQAAVVAEIAFVAFGDLFLRSAGCGHGGRLVLGNRCGLPIAARSLGEFQGASEALPRKRSGLAEGATRKFTQRTAAQRVELKMARRLRCVSVTGRKGHAPSSRLGDGPF